VLDLEAAELVQGQGTSVALVQCICPVVNGAVKSGDKNKQGGRWPLRQQVWDPVQD
jgi:hypothetical protein